MKDDSLDLSDVEKILDGMNLDRSVEPLSHLFRGGTGEAKRILEGFIKTISTPISSTATSHRLTTSHT